MKIINSILDLVMSREVITAEELKKEDPNNAEEVLDTHGMIINIDIPKGMKREEINELGKVGPYSRYISFPINKD